MTPEKHLPRWWRWQKEGGSLSGTEINLRNPGRVVIFQGRSFHLSDDGCLKSLTNKERREFMLELNQKA